MARAQGGRRLLKREVVFMVHVVVSGEEGMIVWLEECVEGMCCGSRNDVWSGERHRTEWAEVGGDKLNPVGEGRGGKWGREGHEGGEIWEGCGVHVRVEEEAFNGGSKAKYRVVGSAECTAGSREGNGGWHFDAECGQEFTSRLPTAEGIHVGMG